MTMYARTDFPTKKALREAVKAKDPKVDLTIFAPGLGTPVRNGVETLSGPHYPKPHTWYARVEMKAGQIVKVLN